MIRLDVLVVLCSSIVDQSRRRARRASEGEDDYSLGNAIASPSLARRARRTARQQINCYGLLLAACLMVAAFGCGASGTAPPDQTTSSDAQVLRTLEAYEPMYKLDEAGRVTRLRIVWRDVPDDV